MKFSDIFVPKWQNSNPMVRLAAVKRMKDTFLLSQIARKDEDLEVSQAATARLESLQIKEVES